jgi:hypothetical protein
VTGGTKVIKRSGFWAQTMIASSLRFRRDELLNDAGVSWCEVAEDGGLP